MTKVRLKPIAASGAVVLFACVAIQEVRLVTIAPAPNAIQVSKGHIAVPAIERALRPVYPYSVIPGGVYAAVELQSAIERDPSVREHYTEFDSKHLQLVKLAADCYRHVSFRVGDKIFWTRKQLHIPKGEVLFTDGVSYARTRCGNRLAEQINPQQISALEPPAEVLSPPPFRLDDGQPQFKAPVMGTENSLPAGDILPVQSGLVLFPNTIPEVTTGARPAAASTGSAPRGFTSPWLPFWALANGAPSNLNRSGSTVPPATLPAVPVPVPEPGKVPVATGFLALLLWFARLRRADQKAYVTSGESRLRR